MKVLQVCRTSFPRCAGGVDVVLDTLLRACGRTGPARLLRVADWRARGLRREVVDGIELFDLHLPVPPLAGADWRGWLHFLRHAPAAAWRLWRLLRRERIELVHLHTLQLYQVYFLLMRRLGGPPYVLTLHGSEVAALPGVGGLRAWAWRAVLRHAAGASAVSRALAREAHAALPGLPAPRAIVNGVALPALAEARPPASRYLVMIGAAVAAKGQVTALEAFARLPGDCADLALVVIGTGPLLDELRTHAAALGLASRAVFRGALPRAEALAVASGALGVLLPSRREGQCLVLLEAGLLERAVIASDIASLRETVIDGENGLLCAVDDAPAFAVAITRVARDAALRRRLGAALGATVRERHAPTRMLAEYDAWYQAVLGAA